MTDIPRWMPIASWIFVLAVLSPAIMRVFSHRARYLDPLWIVAFLLVLNRLSYLFRVSALFSHVSSVVLALALAATVFAYQRDDKRVE